MGSKVTSYASCGLSGLQAFVGGRLSLPGWASPCPSVRGQHTLSAMAPSRAELGPRVTPPEPSYRSNNPPEHSAEPKPPASLDPRTPGLPPCLVGSLVPDPMPGPRPMPSLRPRGAGASDLQAHLHWSHCRPLPTTGTRGFFIMALGRACCC